MGHSESPPPTVIQLRELLGQISQAVLDAGTYSDEIVFRLGLCSGLVAHLIATYPHLTQPYGAPR